MCVQCHVHMRNSVARCVTPARHGCVKSLQCFLAPVYACVGDGQAKPWFASKIPRLLVKSDRFIETTHFAIERRKRRLRSEERRVGKECRSRGSPEQYEKK